MRVGAGYPGCRPYGFTQGREGWQVGDAREVTPHRPPWAGALLGAELRIGKLKEEPTPLGYAGKKHGREIHLPARQLPPPLRTPARSRHGGSGSPLATIHLERGLGTTVVAAD